MNVTSLLNDLTPAQRQAVEHTEGPLLVLAGAGSGKTRVITRRAALIASTVSKPWHVLAITFSNKATGEMRERIAALGVAEGMTICTFHALGARLLRMHGQSIGIPNNFTIFDTSDQRQVIKEAIKTCELSETNFTPAHIQGIISDAKTAMLTPEQYAEGQSGEFMGSRVARVYETYQRMLTEQQGLDFDDLLMQTAFLLRDPELRDRLQERYRYILVDEYQDTNAAQYLIAKGLAMKYRNFCATGDPDQTIYTWRGADIENILRFEKDYPEATVVRLEQNYRSTKCIVRAAGRLIALNQKRKEKDLWTENEEGERITVLSAEDSAQEADLVVVKIMELIRQGYSPADVAIFYRVNSLSRSLEESLIREGIAYQVARGVEFYNRKEIKDVLSYLRVLINPADNTALQRIINTPPRGIGKTTVDRLLAIAAESGRTFFEALSDPQARQTVQRAAPKIAAFVDAMKQMQGLVNGPAKDAVREVLETSGLLADLAGEGDFENEPLANVHELIAAADQFDRDHPGEGLIGWLEQTSLVSDVDGLEDTTGTVSLMTLHAAKGLEFPVVFIVGVEEGLLPHARVQEDPSQIEEERRLFFVGMTRCKKHLFLSSTRWRMVRGMTQRTIESQFLHELPPDALQGGSFERRSSKDSARDDDGFRRDSEDFAGLLPGMPIKHRLYGLGRITRIHRSLRQTNAGIRFESGEEKTFVLEYTPDLMPADEEERW